MKVDELMGLGLEKLALVDEVLERTYLLLEQGWCQESYAVDAREDSIDPNDASATMWCVTGAVVRAMFDLDLAEGGLADCYGESEGALVFRGALARIASECVSYEDPSELGHRGIEGVIVTWNDELCRTREDVLLAVKRAAYD